MDGPRARIPVDGMRIATMPERVLRGWLPLAGVLALGSLAPVALGVAAPWAHAAWADSSSDSSGSSDDSGSDDSDDAPGMVPDAPDDDPWPIVNRPAPVVAAPPPPVQAPDEIVVAAVEMDDLRRLEDRGFALLAGGALPERRALLRIPPGLTVAEALAVATSFALPRAVPNTYYRTQAVPAECTGAICVDWAEVGWPPEPAAACPFRPHIGVIDTGVNGAHEMLAAADLTVETIGATGAGPSEARHGTAIVVMFAGDPAGRVPGLVPEARILVMDPFGTTDGEERADVFGLVEAIERLVEAGVEVISMSLAGEANALLEAAVIEAQAAEIPVVAAVGNAGPSAAPLYPAAYPGVVAVTAVDRGGAVYRRAVQGAHVQFAAPGVEVATAASISGIRPQTGTSFAVPFVTTAIAAARAAGHGADPAALLAAGAVDLGAPAHDAVFGWGLVQIPNPCPAESMIR